MSDALLTFIAYLGGAGVILIATAKWASDRIATRLEQASQHHYDRHLELLRDQLGINRELVASASRTVQSAYLGSHDRRSEAAAKLWSAVLESRRQDLMPLGIVEIIPSQSLEKRRLATLFERKTIQDAVKHVASLGKIDQSAEEARPFLNPQSWIYYRAMRAFQMQMFVALIKSFEEDQQQKGVRELASDPMGPRQVLIGVLTDSEFARVDEMLTGQVQWVRELLEQKILASIVQYLTGVEGSQLAFDEATRVLQRITSAERALAK